MWDNLWTTLESRSVSLPTETRSLITAVVKRLGDALDSIPLPFSMAHRDFGPWNTRQFSDGRVFVLDWEGGQAETSPLYDFFNFQLLTYLPGLKVTGAAHGARRILDHVLAASRTWYAAIDGELARHLFMLYLIDHSLRRRANSEAPYDDETRIVLALTDELGRAHVQ
jgi:hypothetical protein